MKVVQINATCGVGSTGKICVGISQLLTADGVQNYILYSGRSNGYELGISCANALYVKTQALRSRLLGNYGFNSIKATRKIIAQLERIRPDIVHLHNIHGHDCDLETLFTHFKEKHTKLIWTFHDCWTFTGYCPHFTMAGCDKWQSQCFDCVQRRRYSLFFDRSKELFDKKKALFQGLDLTIVTPSRWLADMVRKSFFQGYPVEVIHNGIDLEVFKPTPGELRRRYGIGDKYIILGVSFGWGRGKGLDVFTALAGSLPENYQIVLVGTDDETDKQLPANIISIHCTQDQQELAAIYSAADVFVNTTREEVLGLVNVEALACGTPGVTFRSGGSPECYDDTCGAVVPCDDVAALEKEIVRICTYRPFSKESCMKKSKQFDKNQRFREYLEVYERVIASGT